MNTARLEDLLRDASPGFASGDDLPEGEGVFQVRMNNVTRGGSWDLSKTRRVNPSARQLARFELQAGDVLFNATNSPDLVGKTALFSGHASPAVFSNHFIRLRTDCHALDPGYLWRWLQREFESGFFRAKCKQWVNQATFGRDWLLRLEVPLPPIEEQRRIAAVLDAADDLRTKRRQALAKLDTLTQAIFIDMFGDPVLNPMDWAKLPLASVLDRIDSGKSPVCAPEPPQDGHWGVLKAGAVTYCRYNADAVKTLPDGVLPHSNCEVEEGDVLFARKNTHQLVAACAYVWETPPRRLLSDLIFRLVLASEGALHPIVLQQILVSPRQRAAVQRLAGGAAGSMPNISKAKLMTVEVPLPPIELQRDFVDRVTQVRQATEALQSSRVEVGTLFASLQQRAFAGEL